MTAERRSGLLARIRGDAARRVLSFGVVGAISTLAYAAIAFALGATIAMPAWMASGIAYGVAALFSYLCHRRITFRSAEGHKRVAPRFVITGTIGYVLALLLPVILTDHLRAPPAVAILLTVALVPIVNFILLDRFVFQARHLSETRA